MNIIVNNVKYTAGMQELITYFIMESKKAAWTELQETYNLVSEVSMQRDVL